MFFLIRRRLKNVMYQKGYYKDIFFIEPSHKNILVKHEIQMQ